MLCQFDAAGICIICGEPQAAPGFDRNCCGQPGCFGNPAFAPQAVQAGVTAGPGTELKKLLARVGIKAQPDCSCNARASTMDQAEAREPGWCEAHIDEIVGWLREEAEKRGLPFLDVAGRMLVRRAIRNARRAAAS